MIPFVNLKRMHEPLLSSFEDALHETLASSGFTGGPSVQEFENLFANAHGQSHAVSCANGTDALVLALRAIGVGAKDEVVVPALTFTATAEAVVHVGATPIFADVDPDTLLISTDTVSACISPTTRAVIPVHLYGHTVPFDAIRSWREQGLSVIEDAAQAHLATDQGRPVGSESDAACFSFYPGKNLGALGDGGMVLTNRETIADRIRLFRDHGSVTKYLHEVVGYTSRLDALQAKFLIAKMEYLEMWTIRRRLAATRYRELLRDLPEIQLVADAPGDVHHLFVVRVPKEKRDSIRQYLLHHGVETGIHYPVPLNQQPAYQPWTRECPVSDEVCPELLSLPIDGTIEMDEVKRVCESLRSSLQAT